jgi:hypothetical protein
VDVDFFSNVNGAVTGNGMGCIGYAKLAAKSSRGHASMIIGNFSVQIPGIGDSAQQIADKTVEFRIGDEMCCLLLSKRSTENTGQAEQRGVSAGQAIGPVIGADQFALDTKGSRLKRNEINILESGAVDRLAKHNRPSRQC